MAFLPRACDLPDAWTIQGTGPWRLSRDGLLLEVRRASTGFVGIALLWPEPALLNGQLIPAEQRRDLLGPTRLPPDPRDGDGPPLHAALTALSLTIGAEAQRSRNALARVADAWAAHYPDHLVQVICTLDGEKDPHLEIRTIDSQHVMHSHTLPLCAVLQERFKRLPPDTGAFYAEFDALVPASSAHDRLERHQAAAAALRALGGENPLPLPTV